MTASSSNFGPDAVNDVLPGSTPPNAGVRQPAARDNAGMNARMADLRRRLLIVAALCTILVFAAGVRLYGLN